MENCHCGKPVYFDFYGFTRELCYSCTLERCDAPEYTEVKYSCMIKSEKKV